MISLNSELAEAYNNRGNARSDQGDLAGAIVDYTESIRLNNPQLYLPYNNRGNARKAQGDLAGAIADYDEAIALNPEFATAYNGLCWIGSLAGRSSEFLSVCEQAVTLSNGSPLIRNARGLARALTGDFPGAIEDFQAFIDSPEVPDSLKPKRQAWIRALQSGQNPFTPQLLQDLRTE